ncbi:MAG: hypothetical protein ACREPW_01730, partial [Candidatus Binataceae bacterium]
LLALLLVLSLTVVVPIHLNHRFFPACGTVHTGLRATHHTVVDQLAGSVEAQIDRAGRAAAPGSIAAAMLFTSATAGVLPRATTAPPPVRTLRHLRIAPRLADDEHPPSHTASLRV